MKTNHQQKSKAKCLRQEIARAISAFVPIRALIRQRRAMNAVVSNLILIGAVIVVGFATLFWSQYQSSNYQTQYTNDVSANIAQVQEKIVFEYIGRVGSDLRVYLLNCGKQSVTIQEVFINGQRNSTNIDLKLVGGTSTDALNVGAQGYFSIPVPDSNLYLVKIVTARGSTFVGSS